MNALYNLQHAWWIRALEDFCYYYPLIMAHAWIAGALIFYWLYERNSPSSLDIRTTGSEWPLVSIVVPCFNEEGNVTEVISQLLRLRYARFEIIAVNDGSTDRTGALLDAIASENKIVRVVHQAQNQGKAAALSTAAQVARSEYLICIDGDALLDQYSIPWLLRHMLTNPNVGAVTGNPRVRTRSTILGKIQVGEFSSIIGLIKRTQSIYGRLYSVSGVIAAFRKSAVRDVGYWTTDMLCEDIDITWKLQLQGWLVRFEPRALCWILMPETFSGLWKQRLRWSMGGIQVLMRYLPGLMLKRGGPSMVPLYLEYLVSVFWSYSIFLLLIFSLTKFVLAAWGVYTGTHGWVSLTPSWSGMWLAAVCLFQILVSLLIDGRYEKNLVRLYRSVIWYPVFYWVLNVMTTVWALPKTILRKRGMRARWVSPDRGFRETELHH